jgi:transcriptional regulator GlxA family with amidase domain
MPTRLDQPAAIAVNPLLREIIIALTGHADLGDAEHDRLRGVLVDQVRAAERQPLHVPLPTSPPLRALSAILQRDPNDRRTLAELAVATHTSERTLSRSFQTELGMTFPQWRTQLRLAQALVLLTDGLSVTTVAHRCGWSSASAFIDTFRRTFGHTPGQLER